MLLSARVSQTCSSAAINPKPPPLKPAFSKVTVLQTKEEAGSTRGEEAGQEIRGRNGKAAVDADSKCTSEGRQEEAGAEPSDGMFVRQGGASLQGRMS